jgi:patatin-like phospholipase/acyl hydrolase
MAATITATGTWTPLNVDLTRMAKTAPNTFHADKLQLEQLKAQDLPELTQFIQAMADGYGIGVNPALALLQVIMTAKMNRENPSVSRVYAA